MKTWDQFLEAKQNEMGMPPGSGLYPGQQPPVKSTRRKAQLAPMSQQPATAGTGGMGGPQVGPVSDEEMGAQYAKSMQIQQAMANAQRGRRA